MADDLQDEWWLGEAQVEEDADNEDTSKKGRKRKLQNDVKSESKKSRKNAEAEETAQDKPKKKKNKRKKKCDDIEDKEKTGPQGGDLIKALDKHYSGKISAVENDDMTISETEHFVTCNVGKESPIKYLTDLLPDWKSRVKKSDGKPGSPLLLIICPAALRAAQLNRDIEIFKGKHCKAVKLFAKHMKLSEQVKFLGNSKVHIGLGTPNRIQALIENDSLHLDKTTHVILDWSWRDVKLRRICDIPEVRSDLFALLKKHLIPKCRSGVFKFGLM